MDDINTNKTDTISHPVKRLLIFQVKLAVDALRDIILSPVSIFCSVMDSIQDKSGEDSYFERLMIFGRNTEKRINLFEHHQKSDLEKKDVSIDSILDSVENVILKEYKDKQLSKKTLSAIEKAIKKGKEE